MIPWSVGSSTSTIAKIFILYLLQLLLLVGITVIVLDYLEMPSVCLHHQTPHRSPRLSYCTQTVS